MEIKKLFYTPLFSDKLNLSPEEVYPAITRTKLLPSAHMSVDTNVLDNTFIFLKEPILMFTKRVMCEFGFSEFSISSSWLTATRIGNMPTQDHIHTNCFLSGVVYLHDNCSPLLLRHPMPWRWSSGYRSEITASGYIFEPECGSIVMFPSHIAHMITPMELNVTRHSIAFNIIPTGEFGTRDSRTNLENFPVTSDWSSYVRQ